MNQAEKRSIVLFLMTVLLVLLFRYGYELRPQSILRFCVPQNRSVWELSKICLWPSVLIILLCHTRHRERGGLCADLMVPAAMPAALLFLYWFFHIVLGLHSDFLDAAAWMGVLAAGYLLAAEIRHTAFAKQVLPMVTMILLMWGTLYVLFGAFPAQSPIFTEAGSGMEAILADLGA